MNGECTKIDPRDPAGRVLAWVNGVRAARQQEPLDALPPDFLEDGRLTKNCVIAQALGVACGCSATLEPERLAVAFPPDVVEFMEAHDARRADARNPVRA